MGIRGLKLSIIFILLIFTFSYCGGSGTDGGTQEASINLFIELPEELFSDSSTELSSEPVVRQDEVLNGSITIMIGVDDFFTEETFLVSELPIKKTFLVPAKPNVLFEVMLTGEFFMAFGSVTQDVVFGEENDVDIPLFIIKCTDCAKPLCNEVGVNCDPDDKTKICVDGECITPTPPPTPPPTPTPTPFPVCCVDGETCDEITNVECEMQGGEPFPPASCYSCD